MARAVSMHFVALLVFGLMSPGFAERKWVPKQSFLDDYPKYFAILIFFWCVFVFIGTMVFIFDHGLLKYFGPKHVYWDAVYSFNRAVGHAECWKQFVDPAAWKASHPILQTADVRMVRCLPPADESFASGVTEPAAETETAAQDGDDGPEEPTTRVEPMPLGPFQPGLGLILLHKTDSDGIGKFYCLRECTVLETPADGPWRCVMRTVEGGAAHLYLPGTEETEIELWPPDQEDSSIHCRFSGRGSIASRVHWWWSGSMRKSVLSAVGFLEALSAHMSDAKKND